GVHHARPRRAVADRDRRRRARAGPRRRVRARARPAHPAALDDHAGAPARREVHALAHRRTVVPALIQATGLTRRHPLPKESLFERQRFATALEDADLTVGDGEAVGLIGESGSGKTTLVRLLLALDSPTSGSVSFDGRPVDARASARSLHWLRRAT